VQHEVARQFFEEVVRQAKKASLISAEYFTVDGTLIEAWASLKTFRKKGEKPQDRPPPDGPSNPTVNFHGEKRSNETHESTTDPESKLARKGPGKEAKLSYSGHVLMENRECPKNCVSGKFVVGSKRRRPDDHDGTEDPVPVLRRAA